jgi:cobalt-zinc-cadmium efflux system membrane fusion protein
MAAGGKVTVWTVVWGLVAVLGAAGLIFAFALLGGWWARQGEAAAAPGKPQSHALVRDKNGRPVKPYTIWLSPATVKALKVTSERARPAGNLFLPPQVGTLGYDTDHLYAVRPRFQGEVIELASVTEFHRRDGSAEFVQKKRPVGPGDWVKKGDHLAVVWSKELGDRKVALISALLDLYLDRELLKQQEPAYLSGALAPASYQAQVNKVEKDLSTVYAAESSLGISRLTPEEIETIRTEAEVIQKRLKGKPETPEQRKLRLSQDVKKWARVEIVAPQTGVIVEKNTNVNDMVDPSKDTPLFRIADMSSLLINVNFNEEYLPLLQPLMQRKSKSGQAQFKATNGKLRWKVRIEAEPDASELNLPVLRIAPSLDPNNHTAMVIGRIGNPIKDSRLQDKHLVVGQFVTATVEVPPGPDLVDIPTNALNEVNGESLVLVQPDPAKAEYVLRRVAVVRRSQELVQVRSKLTPQDKALSEDEVRQGRRPIETLGVGELLVTQGVTEITDAFDALLAKVRVENK